MEYDITQKDGSIVSIISKGIQKIENGDLSFWAMRDDSPHTLRYAWSKGEWIKCEIKG